MHTGNSISPLMTMKFFCFRVPGKQGSETCSKPCGDGKKKNPFSSPFLPPHKKKKKSKPPHTRNSLCVSGSKCRRSCALGVLLLCVLY